MQNFEGFELHSTSLEAKEGDSHCFHGSIKLGHQSLIHEYRSDTQQCIGSLKVIEESFTQCEDYAIWSRSSLWRSLLLSGYLAQFQLASVFMFYS